MICGIECGHNQRLKLTGAAFRFRAACSRCSGAGKLALRYTGLNMALLALSIFVFLTWVLWAVGGVIALHADKLENKRAKDAGFSVVPIIPLFPVVAILAAVIIDMVVGPWGT